MVDGDVISDYECGGCKKRTDVRRRTLIAETPNVLIMQLVRFDLNYETWQTEKINSHYEFPQILDLAPYSYHAVTSKERAGNAGAAEGEEEAQLGATEEKAEVADGEASENEEPPEEDCYEYKLVGVTVHSGTAHAGHYWSLINTTRTPDAPGAGAGGEGAWGNLEADTWMEFNDSTVREFQASKLKEECFGGESGGSSGGFGLSSFDGWGLGGGYGKSAYMLFYERRKKKPLTLLEPALAKEVKKESEEESKEEEKEEEKPPRKESTVPYEDAVTPTERPGQLFHKVLEENR
jgi:ubiquitin carboxyl-terminal hydrolase 34